MIKIKQGSTSIDWHTILPDGIQTAGNVSDEVTETKVIKRVGKITVRDFTGLQMKANGCLVCVAFVFNTGAADAPSTTDVANISCTGYISTSRSNITNSEFRENNDKLIALMDNLLIYNKEYANYSTDQLKLALGDLVIYYELAEPVVYNLSISGNPYMDFEAAQNGQIEVLSNDVSCPAPMTITIDGEDVEHSAANVIPTTDAGTYSLSKVDGNTVVWNQEVSAAYKSSSVTFTETSTYYHNLYDCDFPVVPQHKYYISGNIERSISGNNYVSLQLIVGARDATLVIALLNGAPNGRVSAIYSLGDVTTTYVGRIRVNNYSGKQGFEAGDSVSYDNLVFVDLTQMFGAGNEPSTVAEFEAMFPEDYYPYSEPTLLPFKGQALKTTDSNDDVVDTLDINITSLKGTRADGTHEVMFPEGLKKAGSVYDEINYKTGKAIKRIGSVDLGTLIWNIITSEGVNNVFSSSGVTEWKQYSISAICTKYSFDRTISSSTQYQDIPDKYFAHYSTSTSANMLIIHDSSYITAADFKTAMSGVMLYYELATPIEYTIDGFIQEPKRILANTTDVQDVKEVYAGQDPVWYAYYGWDYNSSTHAMTRIGNTTWHKTLPIQSKMRRCAVKDDGTVKYISTWDYTKYEDGTTVDYTGGDGQIMVEIPEYYYEAYEETRDGVVHKILKLYPYAKIGKKSKKFYSSAFEGVTDDASNSTDPKLYSISMLKGGTKDSDGNYLADQWLYEDNAAAYAGSGGDSNASSLKSNFSRPRSYLSETAFRTRATRRSTGWSQKYFTAYNSILRLYTVEYNSLNSQDTFYATLDANEHFRGGLGKGVTDTAGDTADSTYWNNFNGRYPFIPCGVTKELGSNTGVVGVKYTANGPSASGVYTTYVPSYRGIENPFGHLWEWTDGYTKYGTGSTGNIYTCDDITKFSDSLTDANVPDGYVLRGTCSLTNNWFGDWVWDSNGEFVHKTFASSESDSPFHDYAYHNNTGNRALYSGGSAHHGSRAGLFCWTTSFDPSHVSAAIGGRLYYTPSEN